MDSNEQIDIRGRIRAHGARQVAIARLTMPDDWQEELRNTLRAQRTPRPIFSGDGDLRLFLESFAVFFTATMIFLL